MSFSNPLFDSPKSSKRPKASRAPLKKSLLFRVAGAVIISAALLVLAAKFSTDYMWFEQLGFGAYLVKHWGIQAGLFGVGFAVLFVPVFFSIATTYKKRPMYTPITREQVAIAEFHTAIDPLRKLITNLAPALLGLFGGLSLARSWQTFALFFAQVPFGTRDPIFDLDAGFYVFTLPVLNIVLGFANFAVIAAGFTALIGHFIYGGVAWQDAKWPTLTRIARVHLGIIATAYLLILAANHWVERYELLTAAHKKFTGASYTDVHALIPGKTILSLCALIVAGLVIAWIIKGSWKLPAIGLGLVILSTVVVGSAYPYVVQKFTVDPNERTKESQYIAYNIEATRKAYGIDSVREVTYEANSEATPGQLRSDAETAAQIRILDPSVVSPTFGQREANRRYWGFEETLNVDRYTIDGRKQDTVLGVRELRPDKIELSAQSWVNQHIVYTHGYGLAAAYGNRRQADGEPAFFQSGVPGEGKLGQFEERVYFGRHSPAYSIVGAPAGSAPQEFDYQAGTGSTDAASQVSNTYAGQGGPSLGNPLARLMYAIKFREPNIFLSSYVNSKSQILYDRDPQQRVKSVAPFLSLDTEMYPAVVSGRLVWVIDGYTTSDRYPYSEETDFDQEVSDATVDGSATSSLRVNRVNYMRNSVKATVDAFDGKVTLYAWDTKDPILKAWQKMFPGSLSSVNEISGELMSHLRYPADYFKVQRKVLGKYHVQDPGEFYGGQDFWQNSPDTTKAVAAGQDAPLQSPYYLTMQMPGEGAPRFSLSTSFIPESGQDVLTGFLAVDSETGSVPGNPAASYGNLTLLVLPSSNPVSAPRQVQNIFDSNPDVSKELNLLRQGDSQVINGNLLTVPVGGGLLYVQPVYVKSTGAGTSYPLLRKVLVSFGDKVGYADTLDGALDAVFGGDSGAVAGDASVASSGDAGAASAAPSAAQMASAPAVAPTSTSSAQADLDQAISDLNTAWNDSEKARAAGDWAAYGEAQGRVKDAIGRAQRANDQLHQLR